MSRWIFRLPRHQGAVVHHPGPELHRGAVPAHRHHGLGDRQAQPHRPARVAREQHHQGLELAVGLAAEAAAQEGDLQAHLRAGHAEDARDIPLHQERVLRRGPQVDAVGAPAGHGAVGLHAVVVDGRERVAAFEDAVRSRQALVDVALLHPFMGTHVAGGVVVDERRARRQGRIRAQRRRQLLVVHFDQRQRRLGRVLVVGSHRRHRLAHVAHLLHGHHRAAVVERVQALQVTRRNHRVHAAKRLRPGGVDTPEARVRQRAPQDPAFEHSRQHDVARVPGPPGHLVDAVHAGNVPAHVLETRLRHGFSWCLTADTSNIPQFRCTPSPTGPATPVLMAENAGPSEAVPSFFLNRDLSCGNCRDATGRAQIEWSAVVERYPRGPNDLKDDRNARWHNQTESGRPQWLGIVQLAAILLVIVIALYFARAPSRVALDAAPDLAAEKGKPTVSVIQPKPTKHRADRPVDGFGPDRRAGAGDVRGDGSRGVDFTEVQ